MDELREERDARPWTITYPTEPPAWDAGWDSRPFRCGYCYRWVHDGDGRWVKRDDISMPGQFMAVHRKECRSRIRSWFR